MEQKELMDRWQEVRKQAARRSRIRELRERLAVALCQGHLDVPEPVARIPAGTAEYLATVAARMAVVLVEADEAEQQDQHVEVKP